MSTINTYFNKKNNKYMTTNYTPGKLAGLIIFAAIGLMIVTPAIQNFNRPAPEVNDQPQYEILKAEAHEYKEDSEKLQKEAELKAQKAEALTKLAEVEESLTNINVTTEESKKDNAVQIQQQSVQQAPAVVATPWQPFVDHAKANPWRGATFPEGNHLQIVTNNIGRYTGIEGCHPFLIASIHYSETGLQMHNGANSQGAFQAYSSKIRYPANSPVTDFKDQATRACNHIRGKVGGADLSHLDDINLIGKALALYNGCYSPAVGGYARGDYGTANGWDKCPYTANFLTSNKGMRQCAVDGCRKHNTRTIYGTMSFIAHLKTLNIQY